jgi:hypothetical protein
MPPNGQMHSKVEACFLNAGSLVSSLSAYLFLKPWAVKSLVTFKQRKGGCIYEKNSFLTS